MTPLVSVICPIYNEEKYISKCIDSIIKQDYPKACLEVYFVDGMSTDNTRSIVDSYVKRFPYIMLLNNKEKIVPTALNIGIKESKGDVIIRIDGHCIYPTEYVSKLVSNLYELKAENVGAVWNTLPSKNTSICRAIAIASSHKFGVGNSLHKTGSFQVTQTDTVPFGCFPRRVFDKIGYFDNDLIRNQDDEFNARIIKNGGKIFLIPDLIIDYYARDKLSKMSQMYYQYGLFKPLVNKKLGQPATIRQFFPLLFLLGLITGFFLSFASVFFLIIYIVILSLYSLLAFSFSTVEAHKWKDWKLFFLLPIAFTIVHLSYGWGYLKGIFKLLFKQKFIVKINR